jgi:BirA family biotin operon repressor/biotin-[acetyl-CoA-carboxylase] ligase
VAVSECLSEFNPKLDVRIKWPNDLWLGDAKVGGILCEASGGSSNYYIVIGLGLNCARAPEGLDQKATSLSEYLSLLGAPTTIVADEVRMPLIASILDAVSALQREGNRAIAERFNRRAVLRAGTGIEWISAGRAHAGTVLGIGESGQLQVLENGKELSLYAEDVKVRMKTS